MAFRSRQEYIDEFAGVHNLHLFYFKDSFSLYSLTIIAVLVLFLIDRLVRMAKRSVRLVTALNVHHF